MKQALLTVIFKIVLLRVNGDNVNDEMLCENLFRCPSIQNTQMELMIYKLPKCYCDATCIKYKDCCQLAPSYNNTEKESRENVVDKDSATISTCLGVDGERVGVWVVNRCGSTGDLCSENTTLSYMMSHLPVTDKDDITYVDEECARCNNVTTFKIWSLFFEKQLSMFANKEADQLVETKNQRHFQYFNLTGRVFLAPPSSIRVCYRFEFGNLTDTVECPDYQAPVTQWDSNGRSAYYKNIPCCEAAGLCRPLERTACEDNRNFDNIKLLPSSLFDPRFGTRVFGSLLLFYTENTQCSDRKVENAIGTDNICSQRSVRLFNYELVESRRLTIRLLEAYEDAGIPAELLMVWLSFLWESPWRIESQEQFSLYIVNGTGCGNHHEQCVLANTVLKLVSAQSLTTKEIEKLESWTENIALTISFEGKQEPSKAIATFSRETNGNLECTCDTYKTHKRSFRQHLARDPPKYKVTWHNDFRICDHFNFNVNGISRTVNASCFDDVTTNRSGRQNIKSGILGFLIMYRILLKELMY